MPAVRRLALVIASTLAITSTANFTVMAADSPAVDAEARVAASLERYFTTLARTPIDPESSGDRSAPVITGMDVALAPESPIGTDEYPAWLARLRPHHRSVEYRVAALRIAQVEDDPLEYDVQFALERRTVDHEGLAHIARWQQRWRVRLVSGSDPRLISLEQAPRLAFPGTGPQIVCF